MKKTINIFVHWSEILYDVENKTYLTGRSRLTGENQEEVSNMEVDDLPECRGQIIRSIGNALATLKTSLSEFLPAEIKDMENVMPLGRETGDDPAGNHISLISLKVPSNFSPAASDLLSASIHQYLVNMTISDWYIITNKAEAPDYSTLGAANLEQLKLALMRRERPERPTYPIGLSR